MSSALEKRGKNVHGRNDRGADYAPVPRSGGIVGNGQSDQGNGHDHKSQNEAPDGASHIRFIV